MPWRKHSRLYLENGLKVAKIAILLVKVTFKSRFPDPLPRITVQHLKYKIDFAGVSLITVPIETAEAILGKNRVK